MKKEEREQARIDDRQTEREEEGDGENALFGRPTGLTDSRRRRCCTNMKITKYAQSAQQERKLRDTETDTSRHTHAHTDRDTATDRDGDTEQRRRWQAGKKSRKN